VKKMDITTLANEIEQLTDINDHTGAVLKLAEHLLAIHYVRELLDIESAHNAMGYMIPTLANRRTDIRNNLIEIIARQITSDENILIRSAF
jgi:hypothetical protein